jgi:hypothetical protein
VRWKYLAERGSFIVERERTGREEKRLGFTHAGSFSSVCSELKFSTMKWPRRSFCREVVTTVTSSLSKSVLDIEMRRHTSFKLERLTLQSLLQCLHCPNLSWTFSQEKHFLLLINSSNKYTLKERM